MKKIILVFLLLFTSVVWSADDTENQAWYVQTISGKLTPNLTAWGEIHYRYSYKLDGETAHHSLLGFEYKVKPWLSVSPFVRTVHSATGTTGSQNKWAMEYRPSLDVKARWKMPGMVNSYRTRFERRIYTNKDEAWRFRQQLQIKSARKWTALQLQPGLSEEIFYQKSCDGFYRNWLTAAIDMKLQKSLKCTLFFRLESGLGDKYSGKEVLIFASHFKYAF